MGVSHRSYIILPDYRALPHIVSEKTGAGMFSLSLEGVCFNFQAVHLVSTPKEWWDRP